MGVVRVVLNAGAIERLTSSAEVEALVGRMLDAGADAARRLAPVDTGELKNSISVEQDGTEGRYGSDVEHAIYVELGTSKMAAQPYLRPSVDAMGSVT